MLSVALERYRTLWVASESCTSYFLPAKSCVRSLRSFERSVNKRIDVEHYAALLNEVRL